MLNPMTQIELLICTKTFLILIISEMQSYVVFYDNIRLVYNLVSQSRFEEFRDHSVCDLVNFSASRILNIKIFLYLYSDEIQ